MSSGLGPGQPFRNDGNGTFTEVTSEAGLGELCFGSVAFRVDYDNDQGKPHRCAVRFDPPEQHLAETVCQEVKSGRPEAGQESDQTCRQEVSSGDLAEPQDDVTERNLDGLISSSEQRGSSGDEPST